MAHKLYDIPFTDVKLQDSFWLPRIKRHRAALTRGLDLCEETGIIDNFRIAAGQMEGERKGLYHSDSDLYKVLEGVAYWLQNSPDQELEQRVDGIIELIAESQWEDGYINTYFTLAKPGERWTDMEKHETYCGGHMLEAGIAYLQATGKGILYHTAKRFMDHIYSAFYEANMPWVTGHEEVELALAKLYHFTGERKYLDLMLYLLEQRGRGFGRGSYWPNPGEGSANCQDEIPVADLREASGHAVCAMYLYTAMTDAAICGIDTYNTALDSLWGNLTGRKMYVTGGIGSTASNEGFTQDFDLPNADAYCETCAAFGMVLWNSRMNRLYGSGRYADIMELSLYNGLLSGISLSGDKYFYVNPLSSAGGHHRTPWYGCPCCPSQIARFMPSVGGYMYTHDGAGDLSVNLFIASSLDISRSNGEKTVITQKTEYPYDGNVTFHIEQWDGFTNLRVRLPGWCKSFSIRLNGAEKRYDTADGYIILTGIKAGDKIEYVMDMPVNIVSADPRVESCRDFRCLKRGPLVYCVEEIDNQGYNIMIASDDTIQECRIDKMNDLSLPKGTVVLYVTSLDGNRKLTAIPYHLWDNRAPGRMDVWIPAAPIGNEPGLYT